MPAWDAQFASHCSSGVVPLLKGVVCFEASLNCCRYSDAGICWYSLSFCWILDHPDYAAYLVSNSDAELVKLWCRVQGLELGVTVVLSCLCQHR
uniref:Uncharacterized protein n=1 Tax=Arundo donax TaxID=35708 RepID=A0A0A9GAK5_ARUDO